MHHHSVKCQQSPTPSPNNHETLLGLPAKSTISSISSTQETPPPCIIQNKREHDAIGSSDTDDDDKVFEVHIPKAQKITSNTGCPKAADYEAAAREVILSAANTYHTLLTTQGAFPTSLEEFMLVKRAWKMVNDDSEMDPLSLTPDIVRIVNTFFFCFRLFFPNGYFQGQDSRLSGLWQG